MENQNKLEQCVILMAGKGTRFLPATKCFAKEMFPIFNKPILMYHLKEIYDAGIRRVALVISKEKMYIKKFLTHDPDLESMLEKSGKASLLSELNTFIDEMDFEFIFQGKMNGSAGAVYSVKKWAGGKPFAIFNGDDICKNEKNPVIKQLADAYAKTGKAVLGVKTFPLEVIPQYSSVKCTNKLFDRCFEISELIEKPKNPPTNLVSLARYVVTSEVFDEIEKCSPVNGEVRLPDALNSLAKKNRVVCYEFDGKYYDCGNKLEFLKCCIEFALEDEGIASELKSYLKDLIGK